MESSSSRAQRTSSPPLDGISALLEQISGFRTLEIEQLEAKRRAQRSQTAHKGPLSDQELALALFAEEAESLLSVSKDRSRDGWDNEDRLDELLEMEDMARYDRAMALALAEGRDPPPRPARLRRRDRASMHGGHAEDAPGLFQSARLSVEQLIPRKGKGKAREEYREEFTASQEEEIDWPVSSSQGQSLPTSPSHSQGYSSEAPSESSTPSQSLCPSPSHSSSRSFSPSPSPSPGRSPPASWDPTHPSRGGAMSSHNAARHVPVHHTQSDGDNFEAIETVSDPRRSSKQAISPSARVRAQIQSTSTALPLRLATAANDTGPANFVRPGSSTIPLTSGEVPMLVPDDSVPIPSATGRGSPGLATLEGLRSTDSQPRPTFRSKIGQLLSRRWSHVPNNNDRPASQETTAPTPFSLQRSLTHDPVCPRAAPARSNRSDIRDREPKVIASSETAYETSPMPPSATDLNALRIHGLTSPAGGLQLSAVLPETQGHSIQNAINSSVERATPPSRPEPSLVVRNTIPSLASGSPAIAHNPWGGIVVNSPYFTEREESSAILRVEDSSPQEAAVMYVEAESVETSSMYRASRAEDVQAVTGTGLVFFEDLPAEASPTRMDYFVPGGYDLEAVLQEEPVPAETPEVGIRRDYGPEELPEVNAFELTPPGSPPTPDAREMESLLPEAEFSRPATHLSVDDTASLDEAPREADADYPSVPASRAASPISVEDTVPLEEILPEASLAGQDASLPASRAPSPFVPFFATPTIPETLRLYPTSSRISSIRLASQSHAESCLICGGTIDGTVIRVRCGHTFDVACLQEMFSKATIDESLFPPKCCQGPLELAEVERFLTFTLLERFRSKTLEFSTANRVYCYNRHCSAFLGAATASAVILRCAECASTTCARCKRPAHRGSGCGAVDGDDAAVLKLGAAKGWRRCPSCQHLIERPDGCYHIQCRCRQAFCYLCGAPWDAKLKVCSGGCPLFDVPPEAEEELGAVGGAPRVAMVGRRVPMVEEAPLRPAPRAPGVVPGGVLVYQVEGPVHAPVAAPAAPRIRGW